MKIRITFLVPLILLLFTLNASGFKTLKNEFSIETMINVFNMNVSSTPETCEGNGALTFDISNTEVGAEFEFRIFQASNMVTPYRVDGPIITTGSQLTYTAGSLPDGTYNVVVIQTVGATQNQQTVNNIAISSNIKSLAFTVTEEPLCMGVNLIVNVTTGYPKTYTLYDDASNVVVPAQTSNIFNAVANGNYIVAVTDVCGNTVTQGRTITKLAANYTINGLANNYFYILTDCNTYQYYPSLSYNNSPVSKIPVSRYPISRVVVVENLSSPGNPTIFNTIINTVADFNQPLLIPYYANKDYTITITYLDACNEGTTGSLLLKNSGRGLKFIATPKDAKCGEKYFQLTQLEHAFNPTVTFVAYPAGFDPANYNSKFTPGTFTHTYATQNLTDGQLTFGTATQGVPAGNYTIKMESCGETFEYKITIINTSNYSLEVSTYGGCGASEGGFAAFIKSTSSSTVADKIISAKFIAAPADFITKYGALPYDIAANIANSGVIYMSSLPSGDYVLSVVGECGVPINNVTIKIPERNLSFNVNKTYNCGSFNVIASYSADLLNDKLYLQKYYPANGLWGHPETGTLQYTPTITNSNAKEFSLSGGPGGSGYQTYSGQLTNIAQTGQFRVVLQSSIQKLNNGNVTSNFCVETLEEFNVTSGIQLNNYYVFNCVGGTTALIIDAVGASALNYTIIEQNGTAVNINNGSNPIFTNLLPGKYKVRIADNCPNEAIFEFNTTTVKTPVIRPSNLCINENGSLFISGLSFLDIKWTKNNDPTVIGSGNTLNFTPYTAADAGTYHATLSYLPNPNACINQTISFTVQEPQPAPEAGTGQTVNILQQNATLVNLFQYNTSPYDNWGEWKDLSNTGYLKNEIIDLSKLTVGTYKFEYNVNGTCSGSDATIVTINILATDLTAVTDEIKNICPYVAQTNIANVMDNDTENSILVVKSKYTVSTETAEPNNIITVSADGTLHIAATAQPNTTYTLTYRITETANVNNFSIASVNVAVMEDKTAPTGTVPANITGLECKSQIPAASIDAVTDEMDNCGGTVTVSVADTNNGGTGCNGNPYIVTRTYTLTDCGGLTTNLVQTITVEDKTAPTGTAPANITGLECMSQIPVASIDAVTDEMDNCSGTVTVSVADTNNGGTGCNGNPYIVTRTYTLTDCGGLTTNLVQTITVEDKTAPTGTAPANITGLECKSQIPAASIDAVTDEMDNCGGTVTVSVADTNNGGTGCNGYPYIVTRTYTLTDCGGLTTNLVQTITVEDKTAPTGTAPANITGLECMSQIPVASIDAVTDEMDNCSGTVTVSVADTNNGGTGCNGNPYIVTRTYTLTDCGGLTTNLVQTITVEDKIAPTGTAPANITGLECKSQIPAASIDAVTDEMDNCGGTVTVSVADTNNGGTGCNGNPYIVTRTYTLTDCGGLTTNLVQTITVEDKTAPTGTAPANITGLECKSQIPVASIDDVTDEMDNCGGTVTVSVADTNNGGTGCNGNPYIVTRTYTLTDCGGLTTNLVQTITVEDKTAPTGTAPANITGLECMSQIPVASIDAVTDEMDNCSGTVTVSVADTNNGGTGCNGNPYIVTRTYTLTDCGGLTTNLVQTITVEDKIAPTFVESIPSDMVIECNTVVPTAPTLTAIDNCSTAKVKFTETTEEGACPNSSIIKRTWTATDDCGNDTIKTQTINIKDTTPPVFTSDLPLETYADCDNIPEVAELTATDNCGAVNIEFTEEKMNGDCTNEYKLIRTWTATDLCGNSVQHIQQINLACHVKIYNALSLNNDGKNEVFFLEGIDCYPDNMVEIYNRWGVKVYETRGYDNINKAFKGFSEGRVTLTSNELLPSGTYFYILKYQYQPKGSTISKQIERTGYLYIKNK